MGHLGDSNANEAARAVALPLRRGTGIAVTGQPTNAAASGHTETSSANQAAKTGRACHGRGRLVRRALGISDLTGLTVAFFAAFTVWGRGTPIGSHRFASGDRALRADTSAVARLLRRHSASTSTMRPGPTTRRPTRRSASSTSSPWAHGSSSSPRGLPNCRTRNSGGSSPSGRSH